jgi:hypothetical protein
MREILKTLEGLDFYIYEEATLIPVIQILQLTSDSPWVMDGRHEKQELTDVLAVPELIEALEEALYIYNPLPPHRCFSFDQEDLFEYPPMIFENEYLSDSLRKCGVSIESIDEYEDSYGNLHLITDLGDFLICPAKFRMSSSQDRGLTWHVATAQILLMFNTLLSQVRSYERFYVLHERSDELVIVVLLNTKLFDFFRTNPEIKSQWIPKSIEEYYSNIFGQIQG